MKDWKITTLIANPADRYRWLPVKIDVAPPSGELTLPVGPALLIIELSERLPRGGASSYGCAHLRDSSQQEVPDPRQGRDCKEHKSAGDPPY
jgi:hypothetical protein